MSFFNGTGRRDMASLPNRKLHRIREVRIERGLEIEAVAGELGKSSASAALEEDPTCDLRLSVLCRWSSVMEVAASDLLIERPEFKGIPGLTRQRLAQMEATAQKLVAMSSDKATLTFAKGLCHQIREFFEEDKSPLADPGAAMP